MIPQRQFVMERKNKITLSFIVGLLAILTFLAFGGAHAYADRWEIFDQGEHLLFPEGPIEVDGVVMVPLRPIAERFGYSIVSVTSSEVTLKNVEGRKVIITLGTKRALLDNPTGTKVQIMEQKPRYYNGALFIDLALAGAMGGQGHSVVPDTNLIQLRPVAGDAKQKLQSLYWYTFSDANGTVAVDNQGREHLKVPYTGALDFGYEELIPVKKSGYTAGYMNRAGDLAISSPHNQLGQFSEGLAWFKDTVTTADGRVTVKMGYLNRSGRIVIPAVYNRAYDFSDGLAKVLRDGKSYYIDHNGATALPVISGSQNIEPFSEGLAAVTVRSITKGKTTVKTGFINTKGKWVLKAAYDYAGPFVEGIAAAAVNGKSGLIDKKGNWIVKPKYSNGDQFLGYFVDGYIMITLRLPYSYTQRLIDKRGNILAVPGSDQFISYGEGIIAYEDEMIGFKDLSGKVIVEPAYSYVYPFHAGAAKAFKVSEDNKLSYYLLNKAGKTVWSKE